MIRAKTLLASVVVAGAALTFFALNTDHEGYVPDGAGDVSSGTDLAMSDEAQTPSNRIAQLPKLAPKKAATSTAPQSLTPTVVEIETQQGTPAVSEPTKSIEDGVRPDPVRATPQPASTTQAAQEANVGHTSGKSRITTALADQSFAKHPSPTPATSSSVGMPLPARLPIENQLLRTKQFARSGVTPADGSSEILHDPAVPLIAGRNTLRLQQRRRARRARQNRRRTATRQGSVASTAPSSAPQNSQAAAKPRPLRHRKPFDNDRN